MSHRYTIIPKELQQLTGKSERQCRRIVAVIKQKRQIRSKDLPIHVVCEEMGWNETEVRKLLP